MRLRRAAGPLRAARRLTGVPPTPDAWGAYLAGVEPVLAARARVHRFARPPLIGAPDLAPEPLAVWIDGDGLAAQRTRDALAQGTVAPSAVLGGDLPEALATSRADRVILIRAGDIPAPLAVERLGQAAALAGDAAVITCDDDALGEAGARRDPHFRPGPSPDRWLACEDSGTLLVIERARAAARLAARGSDPSDRHALALALAGPTSAAHAHVPLLLCHRRPSGAEQPPSSAGIEAALREWEPGARLERRSDGHRVRRPLAGEPTVEVIVCFRDRPELTGRCVDSILSRTEYERMRVTLVDNGSVQPATASLLKRLSGDRRVSVVGDRRPFHFAALNNAAGARSAADVLVFLNNDTEVVDGDWLEPLLEEALRPEVGAVAPMLLYANGTVQHAGAALGLHGYAGHPFAGLAPDEETPFGRASQGTRNWLAVSAACMMVQRSKFAAIGGFDESFVVAGNDVDLCLRLTAAGHRSLCVPHVRLLHDESSSRGAHIDPGDFAASERSYGEFRTVGDPFYNPNLTLVRTDCSLRAPGEGVG
jgi:GT2 family glycosyltransferase